MSLSFFLCKIDGNNRNGSFQLTMSKAVNNSSDNCSQIPLEIALLEEALLNSGCLKTDKVKRSRQAIENMSCCYNDILLMVDFNAKVINTPNGSQ